MAEIATIAAVRENGTVTIKYTEEQSLRKIQDGRDATAAVLVLVLGLLGTIIGGYGDIFAGAVAKLIGGS